MSQINSKTGCTRCRLVRYFLAVVIVLIVAEFALKDGSAKKFSLYPGETIEREISQPLDSTLQIGETARVQLVIDKNPVNGVLIKVKSARVKGDELRAMLELSSLHSAKPGTKGETSAQFKINSRPRTPPMSFKIRVVD